MTIPPRDPATDERLLAAFLKGDTQAFEEIVLRYRTPIYNLLLRSVRDAHVASDLLQKVFLRVIKRADKFQGSAKFSTWIFTIAHNLIVDHARRVQHGPGRPLGGASPPDSGDARVTPVDRVSAPDSGVDRAGEALALQRRVATAVEALPSEQREVFLMRQLQQLPFQDIADVVGVPVNTVKSRMRYALERLQAALADYPTHLEETR